MKRELMEAHRALVKTDMKAARLILRLLRTGHITLGLGDVDWAVENLLYDLGVRVTYNRSCTVAHAKIPTKKGFFI